MSDSVLYFPSIRVPQTEWFTRVLLYWDSVGTIVPQEYLDDATFLRPYTARLRDLGLLKAVPPDEAIWHVPHYYDGFLRLVDSIHPDMRDAPLAGRETVRIHVDKTGFGLAVELERRGLAAAYTSGREWDAWFDVEKHTADLLMAYLATILGQAERMDPITDSVACLEAFTRIPEGGGAVQARLDPIRTEILNDLLPAPADPVSPDQLAQFKGRHRDLLTGFRIAVEQRVFATAAIEDPTLRARSIGLVKHDLKGQLEEITRRMHENKWQRVGFGTLLAVVAAGVVAADAVTTGGTLTIAGASLGLTSAVYTAFKGARTPCDLLTRPMAYAALAHHRLGA